jgi:hypothetical protein
VGVNEDWSGGGVGFEKFDNAVMVELEGGWTSALIKEGIKPVGDMVEKVDDRGIGAGVLCSLELQELMRHQLDDPPIVR